MRGKYPRHRELGNDPQAKMNDSTLWKNIVRLWPHLEKMSFQEVGNRNNIRAWKNWLVKPGLRIQDHMIQSNEISYFLTMAGLGTGDGKWNWNMFRNLFNYDFLEKFLVIPSPSHNTNEDDT